MLKKKKNKIVFLCSGGGGNLIFIHYAIQQNLLPDAEISAVLTDRDCQAGVFAKQKGLKTLVLDFHNSSQEKLLRELNVLNPDLVITNIHRILKKPIVEKFRGKLLNLHYSLLPAFSGLIGQKSIQAALDYGALFTGVTVHWVNELVDSGKPVVQAVIPINPETDQVDKIMESVFRCGCIALLTSMRQVLGMEPWGGSEQFVVTGRHCFFSGSGNLNKEAMSHDLFWDKIKNEIPELKSTPA